MKSLIAATLLSTSAFSVALADGTQPSGNWRRACRDADFGLHMTEDLAFDGSQASSDETAGFVRNYSVQADCSDPSFVLRSAGRLVVSQDRTAIDNGTAVDLTWSAVTITPLNADVAASFNELSLCGVTNWQAGTASDVAGRNCADLSTPTIGATLYQVIAVRGRQLFIGETSNASYNGSSTQTRPIALETAAFDRVD